MLRRCGRADDRSNDGAAKLGESPALLGDRLAPRTASGASSGGFSIETFTELKTVIVNLG